FVHQWFRFTDRKTANRVAGKFHCNQSFCAFLAKVVVSAALDNTKQRIWLPRVSCGSRLLPMPMTPVRPGQGSLHRLVCLPVACGISQTVIQDHHNVGSERCLNVYRNLRAQEVRASIQMGLKADAVFADTAKLTEAEDLVPSAVGQYRPVPTHKPV